MKIDVTATPSADDLATIGGGLSSFNDADVGPAGRINLAVLVHDGGQLVGGISGYTAWGWLYVQWLWVDERLRGRCMAAGMLDAAEQEAIARSCHGVWIDTFNPIAEKVYRRQGYEPFGTLPDFPIGRSRIFLQKKLSP